MHANRRKILVTTALPYANGPLHIGHIFENLMADIWVRHLKMNGHEVYFFCADDTHGTPIMIEARKQGIKPEDLIKTASQNHQQDFKKFNIEHTAYGSTNSTANQELCYHFYKCFQDKNLILRKQIQQLYCEHDKMFLPDRFVKGLCPKCGAENQYGDGCEVCGASFSPSELKNAACAICGNPPVLKPSDQLCFRLEGQRELLESQIDKITSSSVAAKIKDWLMTDLRDWDISRNAPYFGFAIPGEKDKYFYVWLDAPMGYIATSKEYFTKHNINFEDFWSKNSHNTSEVYHFIGKDITYFHTLFWPAVLDAADFRLPSQVFVHGFIKTNGQKMSKSKGNFILAEHYWQQLSPDYLRYYFASKINSGQDDLDFNIDDFVSRTNGELIGKIINLFSRSWSLIKNFNYQLLPQVADPTLPIASFTKTLPLIQAAYESREFHQAIHGIRELADELNRYFDQLAPWKLIKSHPQQAHQVLSNTLHLARQIAISLKPVLPDLADKVAHLYNETSYQWDSLRQNLSQTQLQPYENLMNRIDPLQAQGILERSQTLMTTPPPTEALGPQLKPEIEISDFDKIDLRVALVTQATFVDGADKLLSLTLNLGPLGDRHIFAGLRPAYPDPQILVGQKIVVIANLKSRKMKFGLSQGMSLAAGSGGSSLVLVSPGLTDKAQPGDPVK